MIIDCHGHYTTAPKALENWRNAQIAGIKDPSAKPNPPNVLDAYVARPDPSLAWRMDHTFTGPGYHGAVLELTSQTWLDKSQTDRSVWKHWLRSRPDWNGNRQCFYRNASN